MLSNVFEKYGGKKNAALYYYYCMLSVLGGFRDYKRINWKGIERVVFVCKGNICRSPFAELMASRYGCNSASFGLKAKSMSSADATAISVASGMGLDLSSHRAKDVEEFHIESGDLLCGFEPWHGSELVRNYGSNRSIQITLAGLWSGVGTPHVFDPYGMSMNSFHACFQRISININQLCKLIKMHKISV